MSRVGQEQLAVWVPDGTKERIRALSREGESLAAVILRGWKESTIRTIFNDQPQGQ